MLEKDYKQLYLHAFNRITDLIEQAQKIQQELEEQYLDLSEGGEGEE